MIPIGSPAERLAHRNYAYPTPTVTDPTGPEQ